MPKKKLVTIVAIGGDETTELTASTYTKCLEKALALYSIGIYRGTLKKMDKDVNA